MTNTELYRRGLDTAVASWEEFAQCATGASVLRFPTVSVAAFSRDPERRVYNNAVVERGLSAAGRADALDTLEGVYHDARITGFAVWVHEDDAPLRRDAERRGYDVSGSTLAMGMERHELRVDRPRPLVRADTWREHLRVAGLPDDLLACPGGPSCRVVVASTEGEDVATAVAFDHEGDRGIYNVGTIGHARRRGFATAITTQLVHDAFDDGCATATLQASEMAEHLYPRIGFRQLGRILEYSL
jgi:hypothetical protein